MKNKYLIILVIIFTLSLASLVKAADSSLTVSAPTAVSVAAPSSENIPSTISKETKLARLITKGNAQIQVRLTALSKLEAKIKTSKLTDSQKSDLTAMIDQNISALQALQNSVKTGTDLAGVKSQINSVFTDYRILAVFMPKINLLTALDTHQNYADKVQQVLTNQQANGKDITAKQQALTPIVTNIGELITKVMALAPTDYPTNSKKLITDVRGGIKGINQEFSALRKMVNAK